MTRPDDVATSSPTRSLAGRSTAVPAPVDARGVAGVTVAPVPASVQASCLLAATAGELAVVGHGGLRAGAMAAASVVVLAVSLIVWRRAGSLVAAIAVAVMVSLAASAPWVINNGFTNGSLGEPCSGAVQMCHLQAYGVAHGASVAATATAGGAL